MKESLINTYLKQHKQRISDVNNCRIIPVDKRTYDIFQGEGWKSWGRYCVKNGKWYLANGLAAPESTLKKVFGNVPKSNAS